MVTLGSLPGCGNRSQWGSVRVGGEDEKGKPGWRALGTAATWSCWSPVPGVGPEGPKRTGSSPPRGLSLPPLSVPKVANLFPLQLTKTPKTSAKMRRVSWTLLKFFSTRSFTSSWTFLKFCESFKKKTTTTTTTKTCSWELQSSVFRVTWNWLPQDSFPISDQTIKWNHMDCFWFRKKKFKIGVGFYDDPPREFREIHTQNFLWLWQMVFKKKPNSPIIWGIWPHVNSGTSPLWNFLARNAGRKCLKSLFLEILDIAGRGVNGNYHFGGQIDNSCQNIKCYCFSTQQFQLWRFDFKSYSVHRNKKNLETF